MMSGRFSKFDVRRVIQSLVEFHGLAVNFFSNKLLSVISGGPKNAACFQMLTTVVCLRYYHVLKFSTWVQNFIEIDQL